MTSYKSIAGEFSFEPDKIKGSRHIATMLPVRSETAALDFVGKMRGRYPTANHHAYAFRLGPDRAAFRYSDDGEPSGSAGRPILQQIDAKHLTDIVVVVSRIFGGTKLGVGGLVRAYGGAAAAAIERAPIIVFEPKCRLRIEYPYPCSNAIQSVLHAYDTAVLDAAFGASVVQEIEVLQEESAAICRELTEATGARARVEVLPEDRA